MNYLRQLQQRRAALIAQGTKVLDLAQTENRALTAEERSALDARDVQIEEISADIDRAQRQMDRERAMGTVPDPNQDAPGVRNARDGAPTTFASFGEQLRAVAIAGGLNGSPVIDPRLLQAAGAGGSEGVPSDGGFLIQPDFASDILMKTYQTGKISSRLRRIPLSANTSGVKTNAVKENRRANGSRWGGIQAFWADEGSAVASTKPQFRQIELNLKKLIGLAYATDELLADTVALGAIINEAFAQEFVFKIEDAALNGTGVGMPLGVLNCGALITQAIEATQTIANSNQFLAFNLTKMWSRLFAPSQENAGWFINQEIIPALYTMVLGGTTAATPIFLPPGPGNSDPSISGTPLASIYGRPVIPVEQTQAVGTPGDILLADMSQYLITDRAQGVQAASSVHVRFLTDELTFRFVYRVDGTPAWNTTLTPFKGSNTLSPFVALATRS
jgi:HK97 family phage major capsid protein